jgi:hypothetical protein
MDTVQEILDKVLTGQNITTTSPPTYAMTRCILEGVALGKFEESTATQGEINKRFHLLR